MTTAIRPSALNQATSFINDYLMSGRAVLRIGGTSFSWDTASQKVLVNENSPISFKVDFPTAVTMIGEHLNNFERYRFCPR